MSQQQASGPSPELFAPAARLPFESTPQTVDGAALARLYGEPLFDLPDGLYIPPDALEVFLESFEGPLDLLLYLIRRQKFDVMDIPMALLTEQYMGYVELIRKSNLELAAEYLVMAAKLMQIKSLLLLPVTRVDSGEQVRDPQAELTRRLLEYEKMKLAALGLDSVDRLGRDVFRAFVAIEQLQTRLLPDVAAADVAAAWTAVLEQARLRGSHQVSRQALSVREYMTRVLKRLSDHQYIEFRNLFGPEEGIETAIVHYLAILELARENLVKITQPVPYAPLYVSRVAEELRA